MTIIEPESHANAISPKTLADSAGEFIQFLVRKPEIVKPCDKPIDSHTTNVAKLVEQTDSAFISASSSSLGSDTETSTGQNSDEENPVRETTVSLAPRRPKSPRSLAFQIKDLEQEYSLLICDLTRQIEKKECELKQLPLNDSVDDDQFDAISNQLEAEIKAYKSKISYFEEECANAVSILNTQIENSRQGEMDTMDKALQSIERIIISLPSEKIRRTLQPFRYFSDLQASIETLHRGFTAVLTVEGTEMIVGSQFELLSAYKDTEGDILTLELSLLPAKPNVSSAKRHSDFLDEDAQENDNAVLPGRLTGKWTPAEMQLFEAGVNQFGWGEWAQISSVIQTRDRTQVRKYSERLTAKRHKRSESVLSVIPALNNLAEGFNMVVRGIDDQLNNNAE